MQAWCVGPSNAQAASDEGFETVHESAGNAVDLANFIAERSAPSDAPLLHVANAAATGVLRETLSVKGYQTVFAPIYEMQPAQSLPTSVGHLMDQNSTCIVLVHSEKGATAFAAQTGSRALTSCIGVAISERASQPLERSKLSAIYTAESPNEDGLFAALEIALATLSA